MCQQNLDNSVQVNACLFNPRQFLFPVTESTLGFGGGYSPLQEKNNTSCLSSCELLEFLFFYQVDKLPKINQTLTKGSRSERAQIGCFERRQLTTNFVF